MPKVSKNVFIAIIIMALAVFLFLRPHEIKTYQEATEFLEFRIYFDHRETIYCGATYDDDKNIIDFDISGPFQERGTRMEWEHAVPAESFGRSFVEWREGHPDCEKNGVHYKGRRCAEKTSETFRRMERDMYNIFPSVGSINARRGKRQYTELPEEKPDICQAKYSRGAFEPPDLAKGRVARASLYMDWRYPHYSLGPSQKSLFLRWSEKFPVDKWECVAARRIEKYQGNENPFIKDKCVSLGLWP